MKVLFRPDGGFPATQTHWIVDEDDGQVLETAQLTTEDFPGDPDCKPMDGVDTECYPAYDEGDIVDRETYVFNGPVPGPDASGSTD